MWCDQRKNAPARGFLTPPATWKTPPSPAVMPLSERKMENSLACRRNLFHVIHKVPSGDSPYVKAKHVQLIEKDPSKAISLFWAAINAGDRVDSALKDMAVVMKQLNRSDEAIEAIKSFRHLCPCESQESIDNVLVELYKRSGRIEEEIEMLQRKLKDIEEGLGFGGKRTKIARSQGKKIQITVDQERSRILGNLAWAYLQHHDYGLAEQHYRKALSLEQDKNKQCNLAICLMHMNRLPEAKSVLQDIRASCGSRRMDDSYAKSFDRAYQMLSEFESQQALTSQNKAVVPPSPVLYTQPRNSSWDRSNGDHRSERIGGCKLREPTKNVLTRTIRSLNGELLDSTNNKSQATLQRAMSSLPLPTERDSRRNLWRHDTYGHTDCREVIEAASPYKSRKTRENGVQMKYAVEDRNASKYEDPKSCIMLTEKAGDGATKSVHKSWADIAEEEEGELILAEKDPSDYFNSWNNEEESNNENMDSNLIYQKVRSVEESVSRKLGELELKDASKSSYVQSINSTATARRSLCFEVGEGRNMKKRNRLEVFRNITPSPDSP